MTGYLRSDGRKGIRNVVVVVYLVECAHHVAREMVFPYREQGVNLLGFPGCYPNPYAHRMLRQLCTHPNVGAVLLVSLGCEGFNRAQLLDEIRATGRPAEVLVIQNEGGTRRTIAEGQRWIETARAQIDDTPRVDLRVQDLIVGTYLITMKFCVIVWAITAALGFFIICLAAIVLVAVFFIARSLLKKKDGEEGLPEVAEEPLAK